MFLWYMASLDKDATIADRFGMNESTASYAIQNLIQFVYDYLLDKIVTWPTAEEQQKIPETYLELRKFPGVCGFIDCTHILI